MKDYKLRNSKLAKLILEYSIVLSLCIIILGSYVIFSSVDKTVSNWLLMDFHDGEQNYTTIIYPNNTEAVYYSFNPFGSPINFIGMVIEYKEPITCGDDLKINGINMAIIEHDNIGVIKDANLSVYLQRWDGNENVINIDPKHGFYSPLNGTNENYPELKFQTITFDEYNGRLLKKSDTNPYYPFDFHYLLDYTLVGDVENKHYYIKGNATTLKPIICMDYVTETNVSINKSILRLTGVMIILGSFSFVASLRKLINKEKRL